MSERRPEPSSARPIIQEWGPPLSSVAWSPDFVVQSLEVFIVGRRQDELFWLKPVHAESLLVGLPPSARPSEFVLHTLDWYSLIPRVVHSTSWRHQEGRLILTYVAAVWPPEPDALPPGSLVALPVERADLARGDAVGPPQSIGVAQVLEHAFRHLSWLIRDDPVVAEALADWAGVLREYTPEPFRALG